MLQFLLLVMLTFHTKQLAHHLIWTPMQRPSIVSSVISGLIKSMQGRSSISLRSVASVVFKYLTSSKNPTFNVSNGMFSLHELCPQDRFYWVSFISYKTISFTFGFLTSFMRTCLFSCFLRTLALISKVSYKSFPSASVWCITGCWRLHWKEYEREVGQSFLHTLEKYIILLVCGTFWWCRFYSTDLYW